MNYLPANKWVKTPFSEKKSRFAAAFVLIKDKAFQLNIKRFN